jgi:hypothetical protein
VAGAHEEVVLDQQSNFNDYDVLRLDERPVIEVHIVPSENPPTGVANLVLSPSLRLWQMRSTPLAGCASVASRYVEKIGVPE